MAWYVRVNADGTRTTFESHVAPTQQGLRGTFAYILGPFRTERAARYSERTRNNDVHECERITEREE
jgi:hypothetical protein